MCKVSIDCANSSDDAGSGLVNLGSTLTIVDYEISGNRADVAGGVKNSGTMTFNPSSRVINCTAPVTLKG